MAWFRVAKAFSHIDPSNNAIPLVPGQLVDVKNRHVAKQLLDAGCIIAREYSHKRMQSLSGNAPAWNRRMRIGYWLFNSTFHSGGRIMLYQTAFCLADLGAEVYIVTNYIPKWVHWYPKQDRISFVTNEHMPLPKDLDLVVSDTKGEYCRKALAFRANVVPKAKLVLYNFETPNWLEAMGLHETAQRMPHKDYRDVQEQGDLYVGCSELSLHYLREWLSKASINGAVLPPAVNNFAFNTEMDTVGTRKGVPYALWCGRAEVYKAVDLAIRSILEIGKPFDLVIIGRGEHGKKGNDKHRVSIITGCTDEMKYALMRDAHFVLAPSRFEGFGLVPAEALSVGTPCIAFDLPVIRKVYGDKIISVPVGNDTVFNEQVKRLAEQCKLDMTEQKKWVQQRYDLEAMKKRLQDMPYHAVTKVSVNVLMIAYWGRSAAVAIESVYPYVDKIVIAYGPTSLNKHVKPDGTLEVLQQFNDPDKKVQLEIRPEWQDKKAMKLWAISQMEGNYLLLLDADEIWVGLQEWIEARIDFGCPRWIHFWHDRHHNIVSGRWGIRLEPFGVSSPHYRWSFWRRSFTWKSHCTTVDNAGNYLSTHKRNIDTAGQVPQAVIYHLGHALDPTLMKHKHDFYLKRDGRDPARKKRELTWHTWNGRTGDCGDGIVEKVTWELPQIVDKALLSIGQ